MLCCGVRIGRSTIVSCSFAITICWSPRRVLRPPAGRRARSRTRSTRFGSGYFDHDRSLPISPPSMPGLKANAPSLPSAGRIPRSFDRYQTIYEPWHYLPALARKPGALRNGAPFVDWSLPAALTEVRRKLERHSDGDRQFVAILHAVAHDGLSAVEAACGEALA